MTDNELMEKLRMDADFNPWLNKVNEFRTNLQEGFLITGLPDRVKLAPLFRIPPPTTLERLYPPVLLMTLPAVIVKLAPQLLKIP